MSSGLTVKIEGDAIVIRLPIDVVPVCVDTAWARGFGDPTGKHEWAITNPEGFAADVVRELNREEEDGTTPVHKLFDEVLAEAIEQGSQHVEEVVR